MCTDLTHHPGQKAEIETTKAASNGCESMNDTWAHLGNLLQQGVSICDKHEKAGNKTEDCRRLWGRVLLARRLGHAQIGAGATLGDAPPTCAAIQQVLYALLKGAQ